MLHVSDNFKEAMVAPVRTFLAEADVQLETSMGETTTFTHQDVIKTIEIQRVGDNSKFFGFGICQRLNMHIVDLANTNAPGADTSIKVRLGIELPGGEKEFISFPAFTITERNRVEEDGELSITAYDRLNIATVKKVGHLDIKPPYTLRAFIEKCAELLGLGCVFENFPEDDYMLALNYESGANFEGTESIRDALNAAAEAIQCVYYVDESENLHFKRLFVKEAALATITEDDYVSFRHKDNRRLTNLSHVTELGDNLTTENPTIGTTQYIRNNPFWELRDDLDVVLEMALENVKGLTISQFECEWRGNLPLEIGDKIEIKQVKSEACVQPAYVFDDVISFDGGYGQKTQWVYSESDGETAANPTNIGDALNMTFAKVDKINKTIELVSSEVNGNKESIAALEIATDSINASVTKMEQATNESLENINGEIGTLTEKVNASMTSEQIKFEIQSELANGVTKVETNTGFTFDDTGLTVEKSGSEMKTTITEDGMTVYRNEEAVLTATNIGVNAVNLHAMTYLIIGTNSRFEDYGNRTGCFWIGG